MVLLDAVSRKNRVILANIGWCIIELGHHHFECEGVIIVVRISDSPHHWRQSERQRRHRAYKET